MYMSPEQLESAKSVDARSDIWSLGIVLYQLLVGRTPFEEDTLPRLCVAIATKEPRKLRERMPAPEELEAVISQCLRKDPEERFQNVAELATALAPFAPDAKAHVDRVRRLLLGRASSSTPSMPRISRTDAREAGTQTDPFARTKTGFVGSTHDQPGPRRPLPYVVGAIAVVALVTTGIFIGRRSSPKTVASEPSAAIQTKTSAVALPAPTDTPASTAAASATATISPATASAPTMRPSHPTASAHATSKPSVTASAPPALSGFSLDRK